MHVARRLGTEAVECQQRQSSPDATGKEAAPGLAWCSLSEFMHTVVPGAAKAKAPAGAFFVLSGRIACASLAGSATKKRPQALSM